MKTYIFLFILSLTSLVFSDSKKINYEYKKFERFDLSEIDVEGESGAPGDLSINPRLRKEFQNMLPDRPNFNKEIKRSLERIR
jgi:hypothetical protein